MKVIFEPIITEKATNDSELRNRYSFVVNREANKIQIKDNVLIKPKKELILKEVPEKLKNKKVLVLHVREV